MINGAMTAIITPMLENGAVDYKSLEFLIDYQIKNGITGLVVNGTTSESPTVEPEELDQILKIVRARVDASGRDVKIIVGTGTNSTKKTLAATQRAKEFGADMAMVVAPYYNKPNTSGLIAHFNEIATNGGLPVIVYDIVGRTGRQISISEFSAIAANKNIIGVKAASGSMDQIKELMTTVVEPIRKSGRDFYVWSGDDGLTVPIREIGGNGVISVASNLIPKNIQLVAADDINGARELAGTLASLTGGDGIFIETNPVPVKYLMTKAGIIQSAAVRLPLGPLSDANVSKLDIQFDKFKSFIVDNQ